MQSFSPHIIKHYIPVEFSRKVIDLKLGEQLFWESTEQTPFKNEKLRNAPMFKKEIVITFKNKSKKGFLSRRLFVIDNWLGAVKAQKNKAARFRQQIYDNRRSQVLAPERNNSDILRRSNATSRPSLLTAQIKREVVTSDIRKRSSYQETLECQSSLKHAKQSTRSLFQLGQKQARESCQLLHASMKPRINLQVNGNRAPAYEMVNFSRKTCQDLNDQWTARVTAKRVY